VLPTPQFYYGMERSTDVAVELEPGKTLVVKFSPWANRTRWHAHGLLRSQRPAREVTVRDRSLDVKQRPCPKPIRISRPDRRADSRRGIDRRGANEQVIQKGDQLLVMEAMKMQSTVYAPVGGR